MLNNEENKLIDNSVRYSPLYEAVTLLCSLKENSPGWSVGYSSQYKAMISEETSTVSRFIKAILSTIQKTWEERRNINDDSYVGGVKNILLQQYTEENLTLLHACLRLPDADILNSILATAKEIEILDDILLKKNKKGRSVLHESIEFYNSHSQSSKNHCKVILSYASVSVVNQKIKKDYPIFYALDNEKYEACKEIAKSPPATSKSLKITKTFLITFNSRLNERMTAANKENLEKIGTRLKKAGYEGLFK